MDENILNKFNSYEDCKDAIKLISDAMDNGKLVFFIGAGVSISQGYNNWNDYIKSLLEYWEGQIISYFHSKECREYVNAIKNINKSNFSNKRKVDLLYEVLEDCMPEEFEERKTEYEKGYFMDSTPGETDNKILYNLSSLDAAYITTNYDNQIEKHLDKMKKKSVLVTDMTDLSEKIQNNIFINTVIHLHGIPNGNKDDFISSGESYKKHYYEDNDKLKKIRQWLSDKGVTLVFIGSSMEEDEVLSLIPKESKNIAILKTDDGCGPDGDYLRKVKSKFFRDKNNTKVLWYGKKHSDLLYFVETLKNKVMEFGSRNDIEKFMNPTISSEDLISFINSSEIKDIDNALRDIPDQNKRKIVNNIKELKIFTNKDMNASEILFDIFTNKIKLINMNEINKIVRYISGNNNSYLCKRVNDFFDMCNIEYSELDRIYKKLSSRIDIEYTSFKNNKNVMGWKIVNDIKNNRRDLYEDISLYNLSFNAEINLYDLINSKDFKNRYGILNGKQIINNNYGLKTLYKSIKNDSLQINNKEWQNEIQESFFGNSIFIKLLMIVYKEKGLDQNVINKILKNCDFNNRFLGDDFQQFILDNSSQIESLEINVNNLGYKDAITSLERYSVLSKSIISDNDLKNQTTEDLIIKITSSDYEDLRYMDSETSYFLNVDGTIDFLKQHLIDNKCKYTQKILDLMFYDNKSNEMFEKYKVLYEWFLKNFKGSYDEDKAFQFICNNYKDIRSFGPWDSSIFEEMIKFGKTFTIDKYLEIDTNYLEGPNNDFNIIDFMNSDIGAYLILFYDILQKNNSYSDLIKSKIESLNNEKIKEFMMGRHYNLFNNHKFDRLYYLIGFSSKYLIGRDYTKMFKNSAKKILEKSNDFYLDASVMRNVHLISLSELNPDCLKIKEHKNIFGIMDIIIQNKYKFNYENKWIKYLYQYDPDKLINIILFQSTKNKNTDKIIQITDYITEFLLNDNIKEIRPKFYNNIFDLHDDMSKRISKLLYKCSNKENINYYDIRMIEYMLPNISYDHQIELIDKLSPHISTVQLNNLKSKYKHL